MKLHPIRAALLLGCSLFATSVLAQGSLLINVEIPKQAQGPALRPYVAVWIEDATEIGRAHV